MKEKAKNKSIFTYIGLLLIGAAFLLTAYNIVTDFYYGHKANLTVKEIVNIIDEKEIEKPKKEELKHSNLTNIEIDGEYYVGIIEMPSVNLTLPVISNASAESLNIAPGVYVGTPYNKNFVICAHNRINFFSPIKDLKKGDLVYFIDYYGNVFEYEVDLKDSIHKEGIDEMIDSGYDLTLFTCEYDNTYRITIRLNKVSENYN